MAQSQTSRVRVSKKTIENNSIAEELLSRIEALLIQQNHLLMLLLTSGDLSKQGREAQIFYLSRGGVRQAEIAKFFNISRQAVQNAIKKQKGKK